MIATATGHTAKRNKAERRISSIASKLRTVTRLLMAVVIVFFMLIAAWLIWLPNTEADLLSRLAVSGTKFSFKIDEISTGLALSSKLMFFSFIAIHAIWALYCVSRLYYLFRNFQNNRVFVQHNTKLLRSLGYAMIAKIIFSWFTLGLFLSMPVLTSTSWIDALGSMPNIEFSFGGELLTELLMIGSFFLSAWVMEIGRELYNDTEYTI